MKMNELTVSEVQIIPVKPKDGLVAFASCTLNNSISLNSIAIYSRPNGKGYRLLYPIKTLPNGKEINVFYPINREAGEIIQRIIIGKYEELTEKIENRYEKTNSSL